MQRNTKSAAEYDAQIARGNEAAMLLSNQMLNGILDKMEVDATQKMVDSEKLEEREKAWHKVKAVREFKQELKTISTTGVIAKQKKAALKGDQ
jgi:hypothetical protein